MTIFIIILILAITFLLGVLLGSAYTIHSFINEDKPEYTMDENLNINQIK